MKRTVMNPGTRRSLLIAILFLSIAAIEAHAQAPPFPVRLTTEFRGPKMCLDVVNGGPRNNQVWLDTCQNVTGQSWTFEPAGDDTYRMKTEFRGKKMCLDINPEDDRAEFRPCGNYSGQFWRLTPGPDDTARLTTEFRGPKMCLDVVNGGKRNNFVGLSPCGNFTGQFWNATEY